MADSTHFDYLIIGGGMSADTAARGIRELDERGTIGILSEDVDEPYTRPALSKKLWTDPEFTWDQVPLGTADATGAQVYLQCSATAIRPSEHQVDTTTGETFGYGKLLIATGGAPRLLPVTAGPKVLPFRSAQDYRDLRALADQHGRIAVVGGGFIGTELAAALVQNGVETVLIHDGSVVGGNVFPPDLAKHFEQLFIDAGVEIVGGSRVVGGEVTDDGVRLDLADGDPVTVDAVVSGLGITPVVALVETAGITVDDGIVVDEQLRTSAEDVWACGDVANYPDRILGQRRVEHVDNAEQMGTAAGRNLAGAGQPYAHTPSFYSDVFTASYEAVGRLDGSLDVVEDWQEPFETGVVYYLDDGKPVGVLLWNVWDSTDAAREVLANADTLSRDELIGRIR